MAAAEQFAQVEAGDVLQDAAAGVHRLAPSGDEAQAQHVVAHRPPGDAARARQIGGNDAADGLRPVRGAQQRAQVGGFADEVLALLGERCLDLRQRRAGAGGEDQFLGRVECDAGEVAGGKAARRLHGAQHAVLGAVAADQQRLARLGRIGDGGGDGGLGRHGVSSTGHQRGRFDNASFQVAKCVIARSAAVAKE